LGQITKQPNWVRGEIMDELLTLIESLGLDAEAKDGLKDKLANEIQKHKDDTYARGQENIKLKNIFSKLGKESGADTNEFVDGLLEKMKTNEKVVEEKELTLTNVNEKMSGMSSQLEQALGELNLIKTEKETAVKQASELKVRNALDGLVRGKVHGEDNLIDSIMFRNEYTIDGDNIKFGDVSIEEFVENRLKQDDTILKSPQKDGTETHSGDGLKSTDSDQFLNKLM
jgi:hypothetical protein